MAIWEYVIYARCLGFRVSRKYGNRLPTYIYIYKEGAQGLGLGVGREYGRMLYRDSIPLIPY